MLRTTASTEDSSLTSFNKEKTGSINGVKHPNLLSKENLQKHQLLTST